jgi:hypothetical protein
MLERTTKRKKDLCWFMVSEGSVNGPLAPCVWAQHHGGRAEVIPHLMADMKQKERKHLGARYNYQRHNLSDPLLLASTTSWEPSIQHMSL